jgi:hypothetical protein
VKVARRTTARAPASTASGSADLVPIAAGLPDILGAPQAVRRSLECAPGKGRRKVSIQDIHSSPPRPRVCLFYMFNSVVWAHACSLVDTPFVPVCVLFGFNDLC